MSSIISFATNVLKLPSYIYSEIIADFLECEAFMDFPTNIADVGEEMLDIEAYTI